MTSFHTKMSMTPNSFYEGRISLILKQNEDPIKREYYTLISLMNTDAKIL